MASFLKHVGGGLLQGLGAGLIESGKQKRKAARDALLIQTRKDIVDQQHKNRGIEIRQRGDIDETRRVKADANALNRLELGFKDKTEAATVADTRSRSLVTKTVQDEKGNYFAITKGGKKHSLGFRGTVKPKNPGGLRAKEAFEIALEMNTTTGDNDIPTVDWNGVAEQLQADHPKLATAVRARIKRGADVKNRKAAHEQAVAEIEEKTGFFGTPDPKEIAAREAEILREKSGGGAPGGGIIDVTGTTAEKRKQLNALPVGAKVRLGGKLYIKGRDGGFDPVDDPLAGASDDKLRGEFRQR